MESVLLTCTLYQIYHVSYDIQLNVISLPSMCLLATDLYLFVLSTPQAILCCYLLERVGSLACHPGFPALSWFLQPRVFTQDRP